MIFDMLLPMALTDPKTWGLALWLFVKFAFMKIIFKV
jgi:hypothetical protein